MTHYLRKNLLHISTLAVVLQCNAITTIREALYSEAMQREIDYAIVLPDAYASSPDKTFPVLYAMHGLGAPYDTWAVMLPLNNAIDGDYPAIIVTFAGESSWYVDDINNANSRFTTFFFDELVPFIESTYRAGGRRELRAATGFSMGGFGAWHYMLERPDFFSSVSSLSGAFNRNPGGNTALNPYGRITAMAQEGVELPPTYLNCGTSDGLISDNRNMANHLSNKGYSTVLIETAGGGHNWTFWKDSSAALLAWHYEHLSGPVVAWHGFPVNPDATTDTGNYLGMVYVEHDPWIWVYKWSGWVYFGAGWEQGNGRWGWVPSPTKPIPGVSAGDLGLGFYQ